MIGKSIISETNLVALVTSGKGVKVMAWLLVQLQNNELNCRKAPDGGILVTGRPLRCVNIKLQ